jgi:hypothetical protein
MQGLTTHLAPGWPVQVALSQACEAWVVHRKRGEFGAHLQARGMDGGVWQVQRRRSRTFVFCIAQGWTTPQPQPRHLKT